MTLVHRAQSLYPAMTSGPLYLVDGFNLLHAVVLSGRDRAHWWRASNRERVAELAGRLGNGEVWVVFDLRGACEEGDAIAEHAGVQVRYAPSADDYIVALCAELQGRREVIVVSADRALLDRSRHRGAKRLSPWKFSEQCGSRTSSES